MRVDLFDFELPEDRIALRPAEPRDSARMLAVDPGAASPFTDTFVRDLPSFLRPGDVVVVNDTRVIPARLSGVRVRGDAVARIDVTLHKREAQDRWRAFVRPAKKLKVGERIRFGEASESMACFLASLDAEVVEKGEEGEVLLAFSFAGPALDEAIERHGRMPLPPYIASKRAEDAGDASDYQTLFARAPGAVAAPTASLHFTPGLVAAIEAAGASVARVTLHVGAGTFLPVKADDTSAHKMHAEHGIVTPETAAALNAARRAGGRIVCVGTTSLRILESVTDESGVVHADARDTSIFITPGYRFRAADVLLTNFHLPRSTLFMLVSAFSGRETMLAAYAHAIGGGYRFYSYGDACLLMRAPTPLEAAP
ncbi:MAG: tRNA preQ1(34) S-adenosylmethionine ribosyltransferase-isomerase QueA [Hyphomicrobiales bacterium]|nr:tRNA preQ1(34) S-adenosylmethionine ribosyltransferase-isomerase QueA [Hyphomicrobiales bacterium]